MTETVSKENDDNQDDQDVVNVNENESEKDIQNDTENNPTENNSSENNKENDNETPEDAAPPLPEGMAHGLVTNVKDFGAFIRLEDGREGLVHISEIANEYVKDINDFVKIEETIIVKVLGVNKKNNKLDLSLKQAQGSVDPSAKPKTFIPKKIPKVQSDNFESKISSFLKRSDEKQVDIRRNMKNKQGVGKKRR